MSAADRLVDRAGRGAAPAALVRRRHGVSSCRRIPIPPARIVKERRATFLASPGAAADAGRAADDAGTNLLPCRRLCRYGLACYDRGRYSLRLCRSPAGARPPPRYSDLDGGDGGQLRAGIVSPEESARQRVPPMNDGTTTRASAAPIRQPGVRVPGSTRPSPAPADRCWLCSMRTVTGSSSWRPTRRYRRSLFCCSTISAASSPSSRRASPDISARLRVPMAAGRCSTAAQLDLSASVKAYFALKAAGDPVDAPHMERARAAILARGGARRCNVFTRITLALFGEVPWRRGSGHAGRDHAAARLVAVPRRPRSPTGRAPFSSRCSC